MIVKYMFQVLKLFIMFYQLYPSMGSISKFYSNISHSLTVNLKDDYEPSGVSNVDIPERKVEVVEGLDKILVPFKNSHVLVILTRFRTVSIVHPRYPILLRRVKKDWLNLDLPDYYEKNFNGLPFVPNPKMGLQNLSYSLGDSKYWVKFHQSLPLLTLLNISSYWKAARPWNNLVSIALFPPLRKYHVQMKSCIMNSAVSVLKNRYSIFPSAVAPLKLFVIQPPDMPDHDKSELADLIFSWAAEVSDGSHSFISHELLFVITTISKVPEMPHVTHQVTIQNLSMILFNRRNLELSWDYVFAQTTWDALSGTNELISTASSVWFNANSISNNPLFYYIQGAPSQTDQVLSIEKKLRTCHSGHETRAGKHSLPFATHAEDGYGSVWVAITGNHSYVSFDSWLCDNGKAYRTYVANNRRLKIDLQIQQTLIHREASSILQPAIVTSVFHNMKFVTCAYQGFARLPFLELLNAFDQTIWLSIATSIIVIYVLLKSIPSLISQLTLADSSMVPIKLLLEQGNPFPNSIVNNHRGACITGSLLLVGVIVSNAYSPKTYSVQASSRGG